MQVVTTVKKGADQLVSELQSAWNALFTLTDNLRYTSQSLQGARDKGNTLAEARSQYETETKILLVDPIETYLRVKPIRRSLHVMQDFDRDATPSATKKRMRIDVRFQTLLARTAMNLCEPWRIRRGGNYFDEWNIWEKRCASQNQQAANLLNRYENWARKLPRPETKESVDSRYQQKVKTWWRQQRAVDASLEMEVALTALGQEWFDATENLVSSLRQERQETFRIAHGTVQWIENGAVEGSGALLDELELATPDERLRGVMSLLEEDASRKLPEQLEIVRPGWKIHWREVKPVQAFFATFDEYCRPSMQKAAFTYWEGTAAIAREASRAKEIIDYWREAEVGPRSNEQSVFEEARHNAAAMLSEHLQAAPLEENLEPQLVDAFWRWSGEGSTALEASQFGWLSLLRRPRGQHLVHTRITAVPRLAKRSAEIAGRWGADHWARITEAVGGTLPSRPALEPVIRRATLRDTLSLPVTKGKLPAIYQSLFRLKPIEDRRFLVGRDQELNGIKQALKDWDSGRFAACLVVGARGSGKTSLLNCAALGALQGREIVRGQFEERTLTEESVDAFLRKLIDASPEEDLPAAFASKRRILMIEEAERTYLRKVDGFQGALHLIHWIHRTAATTLWVIVMNDRAFRVLDAAVQFGRAFSHRINAMNVSREYLESAILERHRLSGLRLDFAPPPPGDPRVNRVKRILALEESAQKLYFDSLFQQSGGVFRSAFELWLSSIDRVEAGALKIRQPLEPAFAEFRAELTQHDHFTLLVIQEHGSLTEAEVAQVLYESENASRLCLERLMELGLVENDPEHSGLRVKPEASRFTNDLLRRVNLI